MAKVTQCDACKEIITEYSEIYHIDISVTKNEDTISTQTGSDACSKKCVKAIFESVLQRVDRTR